MIAFLKFRDENKFIIISNISHCDSFALTCFYEVKLLDKKSITKFHTYDIVKESNVTSSLSYGKPIDKNDETISDLLNETLDFFKKKYNKSESIASLSDELLRMKKDNRNILEICRVFVIHHQIYQERFDSGFVIVFDGVRVRFLSYSQDSLPQLTSFKMYSLTNIVKDRKNAKEIAISKETKSFLLDDDNDFFDELLQHKHNQNNSSSKVGIVCLFDETTFRDDEGVKYVVVTIKDTLTREIMKYKIWNENIYNYNEENNRAFQGEKVKLFLLYDVT